MSAMTLNDFLLAPERLTIEHCRRGGPVENVEPFIRKLLRIVAPNLGQVVPETHVSTLPRTAGPCEVALAQVKEGSLGASLGIRDLFSVHQLAAHAVYRERLAAAPGKGAGIASAAARLAVGIAPALQNGADSVLRQSFADAYAVYSIARVHGEAMATAAGMEASKSRHASGDLGRFSLFAQSHDTAKALNVALGQAGVAASTSEAGIADLAMGTALVSLENWMTKHGVPSKRARAISEFAQGLIGQFEGLGVKMTAGPKAGPAAVTADAEVAVLDEPEVEVAPAPRRNRPKL